MSKSRNIFLLFLLFFIFIGCGKKVKRVDIEKFAFGTFFKISVYSDNEKEAKKQIEEAFQEIERIDKRYNTKTEGSLFDTLNKKGEVILDDEGIELLNEVNNSYNLSNKKYDITIEPLLEVWGLTKEDNNLKTIPSLEELEKAKEKVDFSKIKILENKKVVAEDGVKMDTGSFLKGYAIEKAKEKLEKLGVKHALISAVSSIATIGKKNESEDWKIGLQNPENPQKVLGVVELNNKCLGVSGDYQIYVEIEGKRYHHILDKTNGYPVDDKKMVAVICNNSFDADLYSTTFFLMDIKDILKYIEKTEGMEVLIVDKKGKIITSKNFILKKI